MNVLGGILLYLGSLSLLLTAAAIAVGAFLSGPASAPASLASAGTTQAAPSAAKDSVSPKKPKDGGQDAAKLQPVAPSVSSTSVRPSLDRTPKARKKRAASSKGTIRVRPIPPGPSNYYYGPQGPYGAYGYAAPQTRPPPQFFPYRR